MTSQPETKAPPRKQRSNVKKRSIDRDLSGEELQIGRVSEWKIPRTGLDADSIRRDFLENLFFIQGSFPGVATRTDFYRALAFTIRDRMLARWTQTTQTYLRQKVRAVAYLSAEYLPGPRLAASMLNLGMTGATRTALRTLGLDLDDLIQEEAEPGLGNGGLGRLAACFLDSLATLEVPALGYGIRYEFGIFDQVIRDGWQVETADTWLRHGNPWELRRTHVAYEVFLGGHTEHNCDPATGRLQVRWVPQEIIRGVAYDTPVMGYGVNTANLQRLWSAEAPETFDFTAFNLGDYMGAVLRNIRSGTVSKVLYPSDDLETGKRLRLIQQHFFVSCSLQDMIRFQIHGQLPLEKFHERFAIQLNDTHPAIAVAELMRLLVDVHRIDWKPAWDVVRRTFSYTNHTLLSEALETWTLPLFASVLPRHLEIIYEINRRFLDEVRSRYPGDEGLVARLSLIDERPPRYVRMAHLASLGSHTINGVAELHSELLKQTVLCDFYRISPEKFTNVTNGVTPRRFLMLSNRGLRKLLVDSIGNTWMRDLRQLRQLEKFTDDTSFKESWRGVKKECKSALARLVHDRTGLTVDPASLFDVQVKRIHEYKRQHLNVLHIIALYHRIKAAKQDVVPRTFVFGGKAAPGYFMAKLIIKLIHSVGDVVNTDAQASKLMKVVFLPDFNVTLGQQVYPAAELSEQISLAGKEASGTGNMKFTLNGALTIGTLDGANIEIREEVGAENFFTFGLTADEVSERKSTGYRAQNIYDADEELRGVIDSLSNGAFSHGDCNLFRPLVDNLLYSDPYMLLADFRSYVDCQNRVAQAYRDDDRWTRMSILNVARSGKFSSDRAIQEYCERIWKVSPVSIELD